MCTVRPKENWDNLTCLTCRSTKSLDDPEDRPTYNRHMVGISPLAQLLQLTKFEPDLKMSISKNTFYRNVSRGGATKTMQYSRILRQIPATNVDRFAKLHGKRKAKGSVSQCREGVALARARKEGRKEGIATGVRRCCSGTTFFFCQDSLRSDVICPERGAVHCRTAVVEQITRGNDARLHLPLPSEIARPTGSSGTESSPSRTRHVCRPPTPAPTRSRRLSPSTPD